MDRRLNTGGMSRSMSDRHLANHSPIQSVDRTLDRASPLFRSISQSSRLSSRDKRADFDPDQLSTTWSEPAHSDVPSQANSESEFEVVSGPGSVVGNDLKMVIFDVQIHYINLIYFFNLIWFLYKVY